GADGLTWQDYEADLDRRIEELHCRVHRGAYRAQPSRRRYIPKPDGRQRPLGIAALHYGALRGQHTQSLFTSSSSQALHVRNPVRQIWMLADDVIETPVGGDDGILLLNREG